ncbi:MAG: hypothetical protein KC931_20790 [Candidatus Omnitrophica bacterium]|nr:hypothetical protein [Candidatus Omnitrophota bacterium]
MWSLLLCGECFSWVVPAGGHCPECLAPLRPETPDPPTEILRSTIGDLKRKLGYCRAVRRGGDVPGTLYLTTQGLFFIPHRMEVTKEELEHPPRKSIFIILSEMFIPLFNIYSWFMSSRKRLVDVTIFYPILLLPEDGPMLPQLLMSNPGAFFIPRDRVRAMLYTRGKWTIDRSRGKDLVLLEDPEDRQFSERILELRNTVEWRSPLSH